VRLNLNFILDQYLVWNDLEVAAHPWYRQLWDAAEVDAVGSRPKVRVQEIWANAHETRDSISLISYSSCLGLSPVISAKIHKCAPQPKIAKNSPKTPVLAAQGRSRSSMLVLPESSSAVLVMIRSKLLRIIPSTADDLCQQVCVYLQPFSC